MFGSRRKSDNQNADDGSDAVEAPAAAEEDGGDTAANRPEGPFDLTELDDELDPAEGRIDLGSVLIPVPEGSQIQVEMSQTGQPQAVHLVVAGGRVTINAYAAPRTAGQWREVVAELAESLRGDNISPVIEDGPWGREVFASTQGGDLRFIGVDGPRWMLRMVVLGAPGQNGIESTLVQMARAILSQTIVRRGTEPMPVRSPLPVVLPDVLVQQLIAAQAQQQQESDELSRDEADAAADFVAQQMAAMGGGSNAGASEEPKRHGPNGSASQQAGA